MTKYTKKNCYDVARYIIDAIEYTKTHGRGFAVYLYEKGGKLDGYVQRSGEGLWNFIANEQNKDAPHTHNWIVITDWFRDRPMYTKKELADMIYHFYEVLQ